MSNCHEKPYRSCIFLVTILICLMCSYVINVETTGSTSEFAGARLGKLVRLDTQMTSAGGQISVFGA